jgi:hypothetical protein
MTADNKIVEIEQTCPVCESFSVPSRIGLEDILATPIIDLLQDPYNLLNFSLSKLSLDHCETRSINDWHEHIWGQVRHVLNTLLAVDDNLRSSVATISMSDGNNNVAIRRNRA